MTSTGGKDLKYQRIIGEIKRQILDGTLKPHDKVPSSKQLQEIHAVSSITAIRALRDLTIEGIIYQKPGVGSFVTDRGPELAGEAPGIPAPETTRTRLVGLVIPHLTDTCYPEVINGIEEILNPEGYHLILKQTHNEMRTEFHHLNSLLKEGVAGVFLASSSEDVFAQNVKYLRDAEKCPFVVIDCHLENLGVDGVVADEAGGTAEVVCYLGSLGHQRIGFISGAMGDPGAIARVQGYRQGITALGLSLNPLYVHGSGLTLQDGYESMRSLLALEEKPTAVICGSVTAAAGAYQVLHEAELQVGVDISLVSIGETHLAALLSPPLTSLHLDGLAMGRAAARMLLEKIRTSHTQSEGRIVRIETHLAHRRSCGPPREVSLPR